MQSLAAAVAEASVPISVCAIAPGSAEADSDGFVDTNDYSPVQSAYTVAPAAAAYPFLHPGLLHADNVLSGLSAELRTEHSLEAQSHLSGFTEARARLRGHCQARSLSTSTSRTRSSSQATPTALHILLHAVRHHRRASSPGIQIRV